MTKSKYIGICKEFDSVKDLLYNVLEKHPHTRNSDTALYIECCKELGAKTLDDLAKIGLSIISVHKIRQVIQNKDKMFLPDDKTRVERFKRQQEAIEYFRGA